MTKQQENKAFVKMLKEFPKAFGRISFRERLMLRTAFTYVVEEVIADIKANCDLAIEGRDVRIIDLEKENSNLIDVINNQDVKIADLEKENAELTERLEDLQEQNSEMFNTIALQEQQIEKMKCCQNCKHLNSLAYGEFSCDLYGECEHYSKWEIKE